MARSLSSLKLLLATSVSDGLSISRRGFSAASEGASTASFGWGGSASRPAMTGKVEQRAANAMKEESGSGAWVSSAWAPDPVTGYYRPQNCAAEIDAAELRETLLNHKVRPN